VTTRFCFLLLAGVLTAARTTSAATEPVALSIRVATKSDAPWVTLGPAVNGTGPLRPVLLNESGTFRTTVDRAVPLLVCAGAQGAATQCRTVIPDREALIDLAIDAGRAVTGRCFIGREPARGGRVFVSLSAVESRQPAVLPLLREHESFVTSVATDAAGRFRVAHLAPGDYTFELHARGGRQYETERIRVPVRRRSEPDDAAVKLADLRFESGAAMTVTVRDADGAPVPNATVGAIQQTGPQSPPILIEGRADERGETLLEGLDPAKGAEVTCGAPGFARTTLRLGSIPPSATCGLQRLARITARVEGPDGEPSKDAVLSVSHERSARADAEGVVVLRDLRGGEYDASITAPGLELWTRAVRLGAGQSEDLGKISLGLGRSVRGRVADGETHQPIGGATVAIQQPPGSASTLTNLDGTFVLAGPSATLRLVVSAADYAPATVVAAADSTDDEVLVTLGRPGTLEVTAWSDEGETCSGCSIVAGGEDAVKMLTADARGVVRFEQLPPGEYQVSRDRVHATAAAVFVSGGSPMAIATVLPRQTTKIELGAPAREIRVVVTPPADASWELSASSANGLQSVTAASNGEYRIRTRPGERYRLRLHREETGVTLGSIPPDFDQSIFTVRPGTATLRGLLVRGGAAAAGEMLSILDATGSAVAWARSAGDGSLLIPFVPAGQFRVIAGKTERTISVAPNQALDLGSIECSP
jgi:hypothetical protein